MPLRMGFSLPCRRAFLFSSLYFVYLHGGSVSFVIIILETTFFQDKFGVTLGSFPVQPNDYQLHMVVYLQVRLVVTSASWHPPSDLPYRSP